MEIDPTVVLDVGVGEGTYSKLLRPLDKHDTNWTAVEVFGPYIDRYGLYDHYNHVHQSDIRYYSWPDTYDLGIAGDVLEHLTKEQARQVVSDLQDHCTNVIISVPVLHLDQGTVNGNPAERHIDHWEYQELLDCLGERPDGRLQASVKGNILAYAWWRWTG